MVISKDSYRQGNVVYELLTFFFLIIFILTMKYYQYPIVMMSLRVSLTPVAVWVDPALEVTYACTGTK